MVVRRVTLVTLVTLFCITLPKTGHAALLAGRFTNADVARDPQSSQVRRNPFQVA